MHFLISYKQLKPPELHDRSLILSSCIMRASSVTLVTAASEKIFVCLGGCSLEPDAEECKGELYRSDHGIPKADIGRGA
jgi:hypothetical protein